MEDIDWPAGHLKLRGLSNSFCQPVELSKKTTTTISAWKKKIQILNNTK